jgi:hypothetical protein
MADDAQGVPNPIRSPSAAVADGLPRSNHTRSSSVSGHDGSSKLCLMQGVEHGEPARPGKRTLAYVN